MRRQFSLMLVAVSLMLALPVAAAAWSADANSALVDSTSASWAYQREGGADFVGIWFVDQNSGWAVRYTGAVLATTNGGATWRRQRGAHVAPLMGADGADFIDSSHGWIVGQSVGSGISDYGRIIATRDGGAHWHLQYSRLTRSSFAGVTFADSQNGWAYGDDGLLLATRDGGAHWRRQRSGTAQSFSSGAFADSSHGWLVTYEGGILVTHDGGRHWSVQRRGVKSTLTTHALLDVAFVDQAHGWAVGDRGIILATGDGGASWSVQYRSTSSTGLRGVSFIDQNHGWAVGYPPGGPGTAGLILATSDGGAHWTKQDPPSKTWMLRDVCFVDAEHGWIAGDTGGIGWSSNIGFILGTTTGGYSIQ